MLRQSFFRDLHFPFVAISNFEPSALHRMFFGKLFTAFVCLDQVLSPISVAVCTIFNSNVVNDPLQRLMGKTAQSTLPCPVTNTAESSSCHFLFSTVSYIKLLITVTNWHHKGNSQEEHHDTDRTLQRY